MSNQGSLDTHRLLQTISLLEVRTQDEVTPARVRQARLI
jgi:hypothetical protein